MPAYADPSLPPELERAISVLGANAARLAILSYLSTHPESLVSEISEGTNLAVGTVKTHVSALTTLEVLEPNPARSEPYTERRGRRTRYSVNREQLAKQYQAVGEMLGLTAASTSTASQDRVASVDPGDDLARRP